MNSGLYVRAGDSATDNDAACAKRFDAPTMKFSNVYFGLSEPFWRGSSEPGAGRGDSLGSAVWLPAPDGATLTGSVSRGSVATTKSQRTGVPLRVCAASSRIPQ